MQKYTKKNNVKETLEIIFKRIKKKTDTIRSLKKEYKNEHD
jgi:hypothetical protein